MTLLTAISLCAFLVAFIAIALTPMMPEAERQSMRVEAGLIAGAGLVFAVIAWLS